ncbi:subunit 17 of mediator complex-domain-containing protein [Xylariomycetidae sp. FL2044]|nr:subunit 17 of mediator complex-domain-containing protein [Xylariomycetidae sp. FL2044]
MYDSMDSNGPSSFSLRPWPIGDKKPKNLGEFIARINADRGGFRNVTEAKLRDEVQAKDEGRMDVDRSDGSSDSEDEPDSTKPKTVAAAREDFLRNIEFAHQSAMLSLDFVSLLLSKEMPSQASSTVSPALRDLVGIGTLGASKLKDSNITETRVQSDLAVATGWRLMGINNIVDTVMAAAQRLEKEVELETKYWADVLAVSDKGWQVCALPREPHTLGVRYGFSESAPDFKDNSIAPLRRNDDGTVRLDVGRMGRGAQRVQIAFRRNGQIVEKSPLPKRTPENAPLPDRVLEARNTVYHQELWYELNREARTLLSSDVFIQGSTIVWKETLEQEVIVTLEDLSESSDHDTQSGIINPFHNCQSHYVYLQFLLSHMHRHNYHKRTAVSQTSQSPMQIANIPHTLLRGIITRIRFTNDCIAMGHFFNGLLSILHQAGFTKASLVVTTSPPNSPSIPPLGQEDTKQNRIRFTNELVGRLETFFSLEISPEARVFVRVRAVILPYIGVQYSMYLQPPSSGSHNNTKQAFTQSPNILEQIYPPPAHPEINFYPNIHDAIHYLRQATIRAVVHRLADTAAERLGRNDIEWTEGTRLGGPGIVDNEKRETKVDIISTTSEGHGQTLSLMLDAHWATGAEGGGADDVGSRNNAVARRWVWRSDGMETETAKAEDIVVKIMGGGL